MRLVQKFDVTSAVWQARSLLPHFLLSRRVSAFVVASGAALVLAGCGSDPLAAGPVREAGVLGTRVCLTNNTLLDARVVFTRQDTADQGAFPPGSMMCGEGTFARDDDVAGRVVWATPSWETGFKAANPVIGKPHMGVYEFFGAGTGTQKCLNGEASVDFGVNQSYVVDNGVVQAKATRVADGQWKEFEIVFTPSSMPSADGSRADLKGWGDCVGGSFFIGG